MGRGEAGWDLLPWKPQDTEASHISSGEGGSSELCLVAACKELLFSANICLTLPWVQVTGYGGFFLKSSCG